MQKFSVILLLLFVFIPPGYAAQCGREDVEFYLEKGFSPEQITALCTTTEADTNTLSTKQRQPVANNNQALMTQPEVYLLTAIDSAKAEIKDGALLFEQTICTKHGPVTSMGRQNQVCPNVAFVIKLDDLRITGQQKRPKFIGGNHIKVAGNIAQSVPDINSLSAAEQPVVRRLYKEPPSEVEIPIKPGMDVGRAVEALQTMVR